MTFGIRQPISKLTNQLSIDKAAHAHILYIFNEKDKYLANLLSFIIEGLDNNDIVLVVDSEDVTDGIKAQLSSVEINTSRLQNIIFLNNETSYLTDFTFDLEKAAKIFLLIDPYLEKNNTVRMWGQIPLSDFDSALENLRLYETESDLCISTKKVISVCTYNGLTTPAFIQNELMKTHTHIMTDSIYNFSPFYSREFLSYPSNKELEYLRKMEQQNINLKKLNNHLAYENKVANLKNEIIIQSEQKLHMIISQLPIPIIIRKNNQILFFNNAAHEQFPISNERLVEEHCLYDFFDNYDHQDEDDINIQPFQFTKENGQNKYYIVKSIELLYESKRSILHSFVDITHEKENEQLMVRSEKMNIAGELAASIAHELRNPLTSIKGFFQMLKESDNKKDLYFSVIEEELSRIEQISGELLTLAKPQSEYRKIHNLTQLVNDVVVLLDSRAHIENIEIIVRILSNDMMVLCEGNKIKQVFINLIKNAIDAMKHGGKIIVQVEKVKESIQVQIIDEGVGIPKELIHKIGEPFYTTKEKGTGIGMMVCYQIIERHHGTITLESEVGKGTTCTITLPLSNKK